MELKGALPRKSSEILTPDRTAISLRVEQGRNLYIYHLVTGDPPPEYTFPTGFGLNIVGLLEQQVEVEMHGSQFPKFSDLVREDSDQMLSTQPQSIRPPQESDRPLLESVI